MIYLLFFLEKPIYGGSNQELSIYAVFLLFIQIFRKKVLPTYLNLYTPGGGEKMIIKPLYMGVNCLPISICSAFSLSIHISTAPTINTTL
jgi:hypothetical protein